MSKFKPTRILGVYKDWPPDDIAIFCYYKCRHLIKYDLKGGGYILCCKYTKNKLKMWRGDAFPTAFCLEYKSVEPPMPPKDKPFESNLKRYDFLFWKCDEQCPYFWKEYGSEYQCLRTNEILKSEYGPYVIRPTMKCFSEFHNRLKKKRIKQFKIVLMVLSFLTIFFILSKLGYILL